MNTARLSKIMRQREGSDLMQSVYCSETAVDSSKIEAKQNIYAALKKIGNSNILDITEIKTKERDQGRVESGKKEKSNFLYSFP